MSEIVRSKFQKLELMLRKAFTFCPTNPVPNAAARILLSLLILSKSSVLRSILKPKPNKATIVVDIFCECHE